MVIQDSRIRTDFESLIEQLETRGAPFVAPSDLARAESSGVAFRYDIHLRDIPGAFLFVSEHAKRNIPATFFLQVDYSLAERAGEATYAKLAAAVNSAGLEVGLHSSPADSYFIWSMHAGDSRSYARWLKANGIEYFRTLCGDEKSLKELNEGIKEHLLRLTKKARSIIGEFQLVASHGGEIGQILRPQLREQAPDVSECISGFLANHWMAPERLAAAGLIADVEQLRSPTLLQITDSGKGYEALRGRIAKTSREKSVQVLIHPFGWSGKEASPLSPSTAPFAEQVVVEAPVSFIEIDLTRPDTNCGSGCASAYEKWESWFRRTFKNVEKTHQGKTFSVPGVPLAVIDLALSESEYLKHIGDKSRNMLRKAQRNGYAVRRFASADYLDDIHSIRMSKEIRSGKPIPESFRMPAKPFDAANARLCERHAVTGVGVFKDETLVAYAALHNCGELSIINTILGHGEHLKFGVMNLLVYGIYLEIKSLFPNVKFVNYLTLRSSTPELDRFKKSVGFVERELSIQIDVPRGATSNVAERPAMVSVLSHEAPSTGKNRIAELIESGAVRKILVRGDCCSIRAVARNPQLFGKPQIVQNEKCTAQVYLDQLDGISYPSDELVRISNIDAMPASLRRYYLNQNRAEILWERNADLLVLDSYADSFFKIWMNKRTKAKLWVNAKYLHDRERFESEHVRLPQRTFNEVLLDTIKIIERVRENNPGIPVIYLTHPIHYYKYLAARREFCYMGAELERLVHDVYWGTHLLKRECEPVDMDSCGPGETHHYTPETYARMILAAASRRPEWM